MPRLKPGPISKAKTEALAELQPHAKECEDRDVKRGCLKPGEEFTWSQLSGSRLFGVVREHTPGAEEGAEKVAYPTRRFPQWLKPP